MNKSSRDNSNIKDNALIVFTREPEAGKTKTRLMPYFGPEKCAELHRCMLKDIAKEAKRTDADIVVAYICGDGNSDDAEPEFLRRTMGKNAQFIKQHGDDIGLKMQNAIEDVLKIGYRKAVLIGTDIPEIKAETINDALSLLDECDVVMGPTADGGYYLIGMKAVHPEAFGLQTYSVSTVFDNTVFDLKNAGLVVLKTESYSDIDTYEDILFFRRHMRWNPRFRRSATGRFLADEAKISVIVPVYNEVSEIRRIIGELMPYKDECEIIIVDGGSTDGTSDILHETTDNAPDDSGIVVVNTEKCRALQMNAGAQQSEGDILFFLHCDSVLPKRFTDEIRRVMASFDWGFFRVGFPSNNFFMLTNRFFSNLRASYMKLPFGDQGIFIDRNLFFEVGMYPELPLMEDYEFSMRLRSLSGIRGPGSTRKKILTSARRYGVGSRSILKTEIRMWMLRYKFRHGVSPDILKNMYEDVR